MLGHGNNIIIKNPSYDVDGNILKAETPCIFYDNTKKETVEIPAHEVDQSPEKYFDNPRYSYPNNNKDEVFQMFNDFGKGEHPGPDRIIKDFTDAIYSGDMAPSFSVFKELILIEAHPGSINTARSNSMTNLRRGIVLLRNECLNNDERKLHGEYVRKRYHPLMKKYKIPQSRASEFYFTHLLGIYTVNNPDTGLLLGLDPLANNPTRKVGAMKFDHQRVKKIFDTMYPDKTKTRYKGFSDDSVSNIVGMGKFFLIDTLQHSDDKHRLYFTGKNESRDEVKEKISKLDGSENIEYIDEQDILKIRIHN